MFSEAVVSVRSALNLYYWLRVCRATDSFFFSIFCLLSMSACVLMHYDHPLPAHPSLLFLSFPQTHTAPLSSPSLSLSLSLSPHLCSSLWLSIQKEDRASCTLRLRQATLVVSEGFFLSLCSRSHQSQENSYRGSQGA